MTTPRTTTVDPHARVDVLGKIEPADLGLTIARLVATDPDHAIVVAARLALEIGDAQRVAHRALRDAALDVHGALNPAEWRRWAEQRIPFDQLQSRRGFERGPDGHWRMTRGVA